jgi:hypothetical protein
VQKGKADGELGQQEYGVLDIGGIQEVYPDNGAGNKILSYI